MSITPQEPDRDDRPGPTRSRPEDHENNMISNIVEPLTNAQNNEPNTVFPRLSDALEKDLVQVFKLLSDETRLRVLMYLAREKELHVTALCQKLKQSQPAVSHHLALLRVAGLIEARRDGKHNYYSVRRDHFRRVMEEIFQSMDEGDKPEIRFDDFVLTHES